MLYSLTLNIEMLIKTKKGVSYKLIEKTIKEGTFTKPVLIEDCETFNRQ
jgi:hypothetical protein